MKTWPGLRLGRGQSSSNRERKSGCRGSRKIREEGVVFRDEIKSVSRMEGLSVWTAMKRRDR